MPTFDGSKLRDLRIRKGWSLESLSVRSGVSERAIRDLETGVTTEPRPNTVLWLAKSLEVDPEALWLRTPLASEFPGVEERRSHAVVVVRDREGTVLYRRAVYASFFLIGRDAESSQIVLPDRRVSLVHARIDVRGDEVEVRDCGAANGIFVQGERIQGTRAVRFAEPIGIDPFVIEVHRPNAEAVPPAATLRLRRGGDDASSA